MFKMIKAIVWDIGGVIYLARDKFKRKSKNLLSSYKEFWILLKGIDINNEKLFEQSKDIYFKSTRGEISKEETLNSLSKILNIPTDKVEKIFHDAMKKNVIENKALINFILELKNKGYKQGILSIQWFITNNLLIPKRYYSLFEDRVVSCIDKVRKPSSESFRLILKKMKVLPEQAIFIDDKQENLDVAESLGIKTVLFVNNKKLKNEFSKLGVNI